MNDPTSQEIAQAVERAVAGDEELAQAARLLAAKALERAMHFLQYGSPAIQMNVIRSLMPAVGRALASRAEEDEDMVEMRTQLTELHQRLLLES